MRNLRGHCAFVLLIAAASACDDSARVRSIESTREITAAKPLAGATSAERFGLRTPGGPATSEGARAPQIVWTTPPSWVELAPSAMRTANFQVAGDARAECYLTMLAGEAGGLAANVNRWRTQMSLPALTADALAALPRETFFGAQAVFVDFAGTWTAMNGDRRDEAYRLVGLLLVDPGGSIFLKMVGPESVVAPQLDAFRELARSFRSASAPSDDNVHAALDPHARPASVADSIEDDARTGSASGVRWEAPPHWRRAPERATRTVSFTVDEEGDLECYVTILGGDAGGALANVNRWRKQLGQSEITPDELAQCERVPMLGTDGVLVAFDGAPRAGETAPEAALLGAVAILDGRSVFVKLIGPRSRVEPQREAFVAFCRSLSEAR